jgi:hypothetical protein
VQSTVFTYASNAAHAMLSCARKMLDLMREEPADMIGLDNGEKEKPSETVIICDHTPLHDIYSILLEPIIEDDPPTLELSISKSNGQNSFWLFYFLYWLLSVCVWACNKLFGVNSSLNKVNLFTIHKTP